VSKPNEAPVKISAFVTPSHREKLKKAAKQTGSSIGDILLHGSKLALANLDKLKLKPDQRRA
jgi:hypothetical protein